MFKRLRGKFSRKPYRLIEVKENSWAEEGTQEYLMEEGTRDNPIVVEKETGKENLFSRLIDTTTYAVINTEMASIVVELDKY